MLASDDEFFLVHLQNFLFQLSKVGVVTPSLLLVHFACSASTCFMNRLSETTACNAIFFCFSPHQFITSSISRNYTTPCLIFQLPHEGKLQETYQNNIPCLRKAKSEIGLAVVWLKCHLIDDMFNFECQTNFLEQIFNRIMANA